ncbi:MAG TPA: MraY family glycosyltransferase [Kangiella sp.]
MENILEDITDHVLFQAEGMIALILVLAGLPILRRIAPKVGLVDHPGGRKRQCTPTPLVGGIAIFIAVTVTLLTSSIFTEFKGMILGGIALFIVGLLDDRFDLQAKLRFVLQAIIVSTALSIDGVWLASLGSLAGVDLQLGILQYPITALAVLGVINAINMLDGLDGLASGVVMLTLFFILGFSVESGSEIVVISSSLLGATLGFWLYNYRFRWREKASVYMGDSGTILLGFALSYIAIYLTLPQKTTTTLEPAYLLWLFALPLWDITTVLFKRIKSGRSPFLAGRDHIHHILLNHDLSVRQTVLLIYGATLLGLSLGTSLYYFKFGSVGLYLSFIASLLFYIKVILRFEQKVSAEVIELDITKNKTENNKKQSNS